MSMFCNVWDLNRAAWRRVGVTLGRFAGSHGQTRRFRRGLTEGFSSTADTYVFDK